MPLRQAARSRNPTRPLIPSYRARWLDRRVPRLQSERRNSMRGTAWLGCLLLIGTLAFCQETTRPPSGPAQEASSGPAAGQPPGHPVNPAQVHELLELTGATNLKNQLMRGMMVYMRQSLPAYLPKDVIDDLETSLENA